jgi:glutamate--cysteine ligase catalytic subunit
LSNIGIKMGLLVEGQPMSPEDLVSHLKYIRHHGVIQFLNIWKRLKDVQNDELKFGDEIECGVFTIDHVTKTVKLSVRAAEVRKLTVCFF